jgi:hypothetical protein
VKFRILREHLADRYKLILQEKARNRFPKMQIISAVTSKMFVRLGEKYGLYIKDSFDRQDRQLETSILQKCEVGSPVRYSFSD